MSDSFPQAEDDGCACFPLENTRRQVKRAQKKNLQKHEKKKTVQYIIISFPAKKLVAKYNRRGGQIIANSDGIKFWLKYIRPNFKNYHFMEGV